MSKCSVFSRHFFRRKCSISYDALLRKNCFFPVSSNFSQTSTYQNTFSTISSSSRTLSDVSKPVNQVSTSLKTHSCNCLRLSDVGKSVVLRGFVAYLRQDKFVLLRDAHGITQILAEDPLAEQLRGLTLESYLEVAGTVQRRPHGQENYNLATGEVEVVAQRIEVLSRAVENLPFLVRPHNMPKETVGLRHRALHLRLPHLQRNLRLRSQMMKRMSDYLEDEEGFINVTTPTLGPHTSGGAQLFLVPCSGQDRAEPQYYCLSQSPQTYKQLLMVGGVERYYQFALCYRDETSRPDRQPEFMQLDLEMSDVTAEEVRDVTERLVRRGWPADVAGPLPATPFPCLSHADAARRYGTDKPDTRFSWQLQDVTAVLGGGGCKAERLTAQLRSPHCSAHAFVVPQGQAHLHKSLQKAWDDLVRREHQLSGVSVMGVTSSSRPPHQARSRTLSGALSRHLDEDVSRDLVACLAAKPGDSIVLGAGPTDAVLGALGRLRVAAADALEAAGVDVRDRSCRRFLWVTDFPLFEVGEEGDGLQSVHHPFTAPHPDDLPLLFSDPLKVRAQHYDLVCDGCEVGGGSVRIHSGELQRRVLALLRLPQLGYLTDALDMGAPPHAGIALGVERLVAQACGAASIRDVVAFPKSGGGRCLLTGAPGPAPSETTAS